MSSRLVIIAVAVAAALGVMGGFAIYVRHLGYLDGYDDASRTCAEDRRAIEDANRKAISDAELELQRTVDQLSRNQVEIDNALSGNDQAAAADPDGGAACLDRRSVQSLNAIR